MKLEQIILISKLLAKVDLGLGEVLLLLATPFVPVQLVFWLQGFLCGNLHHQDLPLIFWLPPQEFFLLMCLHSQKPLEHYSLSQETWVDSLAQTTLHFPLF